jgi:hypothetical protein
MRPNAAPQRLIEERQGQVDDNAAAADLIREVLIGAQWRDGFNPD